MHINVYFKECVNGAIKKSDRFYPNFLCTTSNVWDLFFYWKKINSLKALQLVDFSTLTVSGIPMS